MAQEPAEKKKGVCLLCGKKSPEDICDSCKNKVQAEAFYKKKKQEEEK